MSYKFIHEFSNLFLVMKVGLLCTVLEIFPGKFVWLFSSLHNVEMLKDCCQTVYSLYIILSFIIKVLRRSPYWTSAEFHWKEGKSNVQASRGEKKLSRDVIITYCGINNAVYVFGSLEECAQHFKYNWENILILRQELLQFPSNNNR